MCQDCWLEYLVVKWVKLLLSELVQSKTIGNMIQMMRKMMKRMKRLRTKRMIMSRWRGKLWGPGQWWLLMIIKTMSMSRGPTCLVWGCIQASHHCYTGREETLGHSFDLGIYGLASSDVTIKTFSHIAQSWNVWITLRDRTKGERLSRQLFQLLSNRNHISVIETSLSRK